MSFDGWSTALVLGGIRSGKSAFAESLVADAPSVRYVATGAEPTQEDEEWAARIAAHRARRPATWSTEEIGGTPDRLPALIAEAKPHEVLVVDDLGGWITAMLGRDDIPSAVTALAEALAAGPAMVVLVSPEVGLAPVAATEAGRRFSDELGAANRALAEVCHTVALVVAGQPVWLKKAGAARPQPRVVTRPPDGIRIRIRPGLDLPLPDERSRNDARAHLAVLGALAEVAAFAAGTQAAPVPRPWQSVRLLLVHGDHAGGAAAGDSPEAAAERVAAAQAGDGPLAQLAEQAGASLHVVNAPMSSPIEEGDALSSDETDDALAHGWQLAEEAVDSGVDLLVIGACGAGAATAAAAVMAATTSGEPAILLGRVISADGRIDDDAWMVRCAVLRDAIHRTKMRSRLGREVLSSLAGGDIAVATGILLGAASRRTPVLLDGPVGVAAGLVSRDFGGQARHWCLLPDDGGHPGVRHAADLLDLKPVFNLRLGLGTAEGATALAVLPVLRTALTLAGTVPPAPASE